MSAICQVVTYVCESLFGSRTGNHTILTQGGVPIVTQNNVPLETQT